ncbi:MULTISPECIES: YqaJ viral recombinase family protein [Burkholderia]|uniref:YqaJ viral recombinase family protein n=3 Tax=Burkholderia glumae TaxID=337 RepID=A0AAQ0BU44_BURGL|nr:MULTISPECIES: YqaJ viral recombinase family protein [Burkholderia]ACR29176.2 phage-type endonuclease [Burkholderia glumae BGR1]AJY64923.1 yqaJ-like viral recombinase domain protein [Burkholderia glumae LMG 2196 = ATCC 33617]PNL01270.1 endonuclease [Burkholderia glumae]QPQ93190.1 YqaJ viral recombinase family protein [Burkholderia glumae]QQM91607.1 YqaJ viral recombinase family protein [Burkholderia glumae]
MTERIIHDLIQGTPEWEAFRLEHFGASEAAAMLGISPKVKRNELLHMKHTGTPKEFSDWVQEHILDRGHEVEALARPFAEEVIGEDLYPVTCSFGVPSASCDGLTMDHSTAWEHKQWNEDLAKSLRAGVLPDEHQPQVQQNMHVTGASRLLFTCSNGTEEKMVHLWVAPDPEWVARINAGWEQFAKDLATYQPRDIREAPKGEAILSLPTLAVQIRGEVVSSNLPRFKAAAESFIANIKTDLKTDEDFANAASTVSFCEKAEKELEMAKNAAIGQTASIDELMRTLDHISAQLREKRLALDKLVTKRKGEIKDEIILGGKSAYAAHIKSLNDELADVTLVVAVPDFVTAAKNKRTLASLHEAIDTAVANGKIAADAAARDLRAKLDWYRKQAAEHTFLFRDLQQLIQKPAEDFHLAVDARIEQHKKQQAEEAERKRAAERAAADEAAAAAAAKANAAPAVDEPAPAAAQATRQPAPQTTSVPAAASAGPRRGTGGSMRTQPSRPSDDEIVGVLALHYRQHESKIVEWLLAMDLKAASERLAAAF